MADETGLVVIAEAPAVGLQGHNMVRETLVRHLEVLTELVVRDKNRASVVMWSVANEPDSEAQTANVYFKHLAAHTRALDPSRPVTFATFKSPERDVAAQHVDLLMINRYHAWYTNTGQVAAPTAESTLPAPSLPTPRPRRPRATSTFPADLPSCPRVPLPPHPPPAPPAPPVPPQLDAIPPLLERDLRAWHAKFGVPLLMSEYGAECIPGMHADPPIAFSEEFQAEYLSQVRGGHVAATWRAPSGQALLLSRRVRARLPRAPRRVIGRAAGMCGRGGVRLQPDGSSRPPCW